MAQRDDLDRFLQDLDYPLYIVTVASETETGPASRSGCLVGFATQCSIDPPRLLVCISKINHSFELMSRARMVGVHVVDADQRDLAELFGGETGDDIDKFAACMWRPGPCGLPVLTGCRRKMIAEVVDRVELGDHLGLVLAPFEVHVEEAAGQLQPSEISDLEAGHPL